MQRLEARTEQLSLVEGVKQGRSDLVAEGEPAVSLAPGARKGQLYMVAEANERLPKTGAACRLVLRVARQAFGANTSFSITTALRVAISAANKVLYEQNFKLPVHQRIHVGLTCAVLRDGDLFVAQIQPTQAYVLSKGRIRPLPAHPSWDPAHLSAAPFARTGALGASLFIEPELYRCAMTVGDGAILCSSNFAHLLGRAEIDVALRQREPTLAVERLQQVATTHNLDQAHGLVITLGQAPRLATAAPALDAAPAGAHGRLSNRSLGVWLVGLVGKTGWSVGPRPSSRRNPPARPDPLYTMPEDPGLPAVPIPRPAPLEVGESMGALYERNQRTLPDLAPLRPENLPPSTFIGEDVTSVTETRRFDLADPDLKTPARPYRARHEARPLIDLSWPERLTLPFRRLAITIEHSWRGRHRRRGAPLPPRPIMRGQGLSYRRTRPPFPWTLLLGLIVVVGALIFYGTSLTQQNDQQVVNAYFTAAEGHLAAVRETPDESSALATLDLARQAIDEVRASSTVTSTNPTLWLRLQELEREYERALASVERLTFFENPVVLTQHPLPSGKFISVVVPPPLPNITDTAVIENMSYIYAIDSDAQHPRIYRIPRNGGAPEAYLSPGQSVGTVVVGPLRGALWRTDQVVAIDENPNGFGYYFRTGSIWNYAKLGASEVWRLHDRLDVEEYDGNLYVWGVQTNEVLRFRSGSYNDTPDYWLNPNNLQNIDLSTVVDMGVDGSIYLLRSNGSVLVFSQGQLVSEIFPEALTPPLTVATRFFVTGTSPENGFFFLVDTLNERIIQMDKVTGKVIQQIKVHADSPIRLDQLAGIFVDLSGSRTIIYLVNAGTIIRTELPTPPRPFREATPSALSAPTSGPLPLP